MASKSKFSIQQPPSILQGSLSIDSLEKIKNINTFNLHFIKPELLKISERSHFSRDKADEIEESIEKNGLFHNLYVFPVNNGEYYEILSGNTRFIALQRLIKKGNSPYAEGIPCAIAPADLSDIDVDIIIDEANVKSRQNPKEIIAAVARLKDNYSKRNEQLGIKGNVYQQIQENTDLSERTIRRYVSIEEKLIPGLKEQFFSGKLSQEAAANLSTQDITVQEVFLAKLEETDNASKQEIKKLKEESIAIANEKQLEIERILEEKRKIEADKKELEEKISGREHELNEISEKLKITECKLMEAQNHPSDVDDSRIQELESEIQSYQDTVQRITSENESLKQQVIQKAEASQEKKVELNNISNAAPLTDDEKLLQKEQFQIDLIKEEILKQIEKYHIAVSNYEISHNCTYEPIKLSDLKNIQDLYK